MLNPHVTTSWIDNEPAASRALAELARLGRRALRRPLLLVSLSVLGAAAFVGWRSRAIRWYTARAVLRVTEGEFDPLTSPNTRRKLRSYVLEAALTNPRLLEIVRKHKLYPLLLHDDPNAAVSALRNDMRVDVYMNYFLEERGVDDPPRSARIAISYRGRNPAVAQSVVSELSKIVEQNEHLTRQTEAEQVVAVLDQGVDEAARNLADARREMFERTLELDRAPKTQAVALRVQIDQLARSINGLEIQLKDATENKQRFDIRARFEEEQRGIHFDVVDMRIEESAAVWSSRAVQLAVMGGIGLLLALPLVAIGLGALDSRIYDGDDIGRLGMHAVGVIPAYAGDSIGTLAERRRARPGSEVR
jgi:hypothetical protein